MRSSEQIDLIATALSLAQSKFPPIEKTRINPHFKSKFANLSDILSACIPVLSKHDLAFSQGLSFHEGRLIITARLMHKSGQWLECELAIRPAKDDPQALGSAATYGRRYTAEALLGVSATDDDDGEMATNTKSGQNQQSYSKSEPVYMGTADQHVKLKQLLSELGLIEAAPQFIIDLNKAVHGIPFTKIREFVLKFAKERGMS